MRVMLAPDSFKGSLTAAQAADAMAAGIARINSGDDPNIEVDRCPISDGGEGFLDTMLAATGGQRLTAKVTGPLGEPLEADWGLIDGGTAAVIEMAEAAGLGLVPEGHRDPTRTTTYGVGQLVAEAWGRGVESVLIGIGGSGTNDGGTGLAQALGYRFFDRADRLISEPMCGGRLGDITRIDRAQIHPHVARSAVRVACDVNNPLTGSNGAAAVYGPQKGATPAQVQTLDAGLGNLAEVLADTFGGGFDFPGAGAAGGMGAGLSAFCRADLSPGIGLVLDAIGFAERVAGCGLCLTGEGRLDGQSLSGKAVLAVANAAGREEVPTVALVGSVGEGGDAALQHGLAAYREVGAGHPTAYAIRHAAALLADHAEAVVRERLG